MWAGQSVIIVGCDYSSSSTTTTGLWLSANLRGIKDSVPLTNLCSAGRCWCETCSEVKLSTKNLATAPKTVQKSPPKTVQQHQKPCNNTQDRAIAHKNRATAPKLCNSARNCATSPKTAAHLITNSGMSSAPHCKTTAWKQQGFWRFSFCSVLNYVHSGPGDCWSSGDDEGRDPSLTICSFSTSGGFSFGMSL